MAKTADIPLRPIAEVAQELLDIRAELNVTKAAEKACSDELKKRMENGEEQDYFQFNTSTTLKVKDARKAIAWAKKNAPNIVTVDARAARQIFLRDALTGSLGTPEKAGFELVESKQLREIRKGGDENNYDLAA